MFRAIVWSFVSVVSVWPLQAQDRDPLQRFKALDRDNDGKLTLTEAGKAAWARYERMDFDGDGSLTSAEFQSFLTRQDRPGAVPSSFVVRTFKHDSQGEIKYGWFAPQNLAAGTKVPLVLCLHGAGGSTRAAEVLAMPRMQDKFPCFVMAPGCDKREIWGNTDVLSRQREHERLPLIVEALRSLMKQTAIDPDRLYVTGQSMGGVGTWAALARYPDLFAAGVPVCGAWNPNDVNRLVKTPVWAFHGAADLTVPPKWSRELVAAINQAGGSAKYTEYPDTGHGIWGQAYNTDELWTWLFEQRLKSSEP